MPDARLDRTRRAYEAPPQVGVQLVVDVMAAAQRPPSTNAVDPHAHPSGTPSPRADRSSSSLPPSHWNVIEGEHHDA